MSTIVKRGNYLSFCFYNPAKKRSDYSPTGCLDTRDGWKEARKKQKDFDRDLEKKRSLHARSGAVSRATLFSDAYEKFISHKKFAAATITNKERARDALIELIGDKSIGDYTKEDFERFNRLLSEKQAEHYARPRVENPKKKKKIEGERPPADPQRPARCISQNTQSIRTKDVRAMFNYFLKHDWISRNHVIRVKELKKKPRSIDPSDLQELLEHIRTAKFKNGELKYKKLYNAIFFMACTGFRTAETAKLEWKDVFLKKDPPSIMAFNKVTGDEEPVPMLRPVYELLSSMNPNGDKKGKVFNYKNKDAFSAYDSIQIKLWGEHRYNKHQLRKIFITQLLEAGVPLEDVKEFSRHSSKSMEIIMDHYNEVKAKRLKEKTDVKMAGFLDSLTRKNEPSGS